MILKLFLLLSLTLTLTSCGDEGRDTDFQQEQDQRQEGTFETLLDPIGSVSSQGQASLNVDNDGRFSTGINMQNLSPGSTYRQYILSGNACPVASDDPDGNGTLTLSEALIVTGPILIPLDDNLKEQDAGTVHPVAASNGTYTYEQGVSMEDMMVDLRKPDTNDDDNVIKLSPDERGLNMEGRVVMITRVQGNEEIPEACGVLERGRRSREIQNEEAPPADSTDLTLLHEHFGNRPSNNLYISGNRCQGGETMDTPDGGTQVCNANQWYVYVDNVNTCTSEEACTEVAVEPIIANLRRGSQNLYEIQPASPTPDDKRAILRNHWVRFDERDLPVVMPKN